MDPLLIVGFLKRTWMIWAALALFSTGYIKGCTDAKEDFDSFVAATEAVGKQQEAWAGRVAERSKQLTAEAEERYRARIAELARSHKRRLNELQLDTHRGVLPAVPDNASGSSNASTLCFDRAKLSGGIAAALDKLLAGLAQVVHRGDSNTIGLLECFASWKEQERMRDATK